VEGCLVALRANVPGTCCVVFAELADH